MLGPFSPRTTFTLSPEGLLSIATLDERSLVASLVSLPA